MASTPTIPSLPSLAQQLGLITAQLTTITRQLEAMSAPPPPPPPRVETYKLVLVGADGVGKTTFVKQLRTGKFEPKYVATLGVEVHPIRYTTQYGEVVFNIWDTAGQEALGGLRDGYYKGASCAIVMCDPDVESSVEKARWYVKEIKRVCGKIPIIVVRNFKDTWYNFNQDVETHENFAINVRTTWGIHQPLLFLARSLIKLPDLHFLICGCKCNCDEPCKCICKKGIFPRPHCECACKCAEPLAHYQI